MVRTKNQIRGSKSKGSQFEMDVEYSLKKVYPNMKRLGGEGQYREIDLVDNVAHISVECKRHKSFGWNELVGYLTKLHLRAEFEHTCYLIYQENYKQVFVMRKILGIPTVSLFEDYFRIPFEQHKTIKRGGENAVSGS